ncbi:LOG family protein [Dioscorea alata]|uniref:LOG family protein n=1 Tax=Dioscorea alata TaxID=55571 RepID=A0ACB7UCR7_DIOAL|nr:LOG family protein [Dioscorea alata]
MSVSKFKTICVFCGSSLGNKKSYQDASIDLAKELVLKNIDLVYGEGNIGVMGLISQTVFDGGKYVLGYDFIHLLNVIPKIVMGKEMTDNTIREVKSIENMHQRKAEMSSILMPLFLCLVGLLNIDGYYNSLLSFIDQVVQEGFIKPSARHSIVFASNAKELIEKLEVIILLQLQDYYPCHEEVSLKLN